LKSYKFVYRYVFFCGFFNEINRFFQLNAIGYIDSIG
jgi:hypothetical protein